MLPVFILAQLDHHGACTILAEVAKAQFGWCAFCGEIVNCFLAEKKRADAKIFCLDVVAVLHVGPFFW